MTQAIMRRLFYKLLIITTLITVGITSQTRATHIMGSDITWECLGNDSFEVTLSVYRDCTGVGLNPPVLDITCKSGGSAIGITKTLKGGVTVKDVTPVCESSCTQCSSSGCSFQYGIEKHTVTYIVDMSNSNCCKVGFSYDGCCRSNKITTGLAHDSFYVQSWMDRCKAPCNSSPSFKEPPIGILCKGQKFIYNQGASDDDTDSTGGLLDSLSYSFTRPLKGENQPVSYNGKNSYKKPLNFKGFPDETLPFPLGFSLDEVTGDLKFTPTKAGQVSVMAFSIDEYRDTDGDGKRNEQVSQIRRDLQFFVIKCPNNKAPTIKGMKCPKDDFYEEICAGKLSSFTFCTDDDNPKDSVKINFNQGNIPGSPTWEVLNPKARFQNGQLKWTPKDKDASKIPYQFTVSAVDDNCPVNARTVQSYRLRVKPQPKASYKYNYLKCGRFNFSASPIEGQNMKFTWRSEGGMFGTGRNFQYKFQEPGKYPFKLTVTAEGCPNVYYDTIDLDPFLRVDIGNDTAICNSGTVQLGGKAKDNNGPVTYTWHDNVTGQTSRTFKNIKKDTFISLTVTDTVCSYTDSVFIDIRKPPKMNLGTDPRICANDSFFLNPTLVKDFDSTGNTPWVYLDDGLQDADFKWYKDQVSNSPFSTNDTIEISEAGTIILEAKDSLGCNNTDTITINTNPELNPEAKPPRICRGDTGKLVANKTGGANANYVWINLRTNDTVDGRTPLVDPDTTTRYALIVEETVKGVYCRDSATTELVVDTLPEVTLSSIPDVCSNGNLVDLQQYADPQGGVWEALDKAHEDAIGNSKSSFDPNAVEDGVIPLTYSYTDPSTNCTKSKVTNIRVLPLPNVSTLQDTILCTHEGALKLKQSPTSPGNGAWNGVEGSGAGIENTGNNEWAFNPNASGIDQGTYVAVYSYTQTPPQECSNYDTVKITVQNSPQPNLSEKEICIDNKELDLSTISNGVTWYGEHVQSETFINPEEAGNYYANYDKSNNIYRTCTINDSIQMKVNDTPRVTASTVSGDTLFCEGRQTVNLRGTQSAGGANAGDWRITSEGTLNGTKFSPQQNGPGTYRFIYEYTDPRTQCKNSEALVIQVDTIPEVALEKNGNVKCIGQQYTIKADFDHAERLTWSANGRADGAGFSNVTIGNSTTTAMYEPNAEQKEAEAFRIYIEASNDGICEPVKDSIMVELKPEPRPDFSAPRNGCPPYKARFENQSVISSGGTITNYTWQFGDGESSETENPEHRYEESGQYTVQLRAESKGGCVNQITKQNYINVYQAPEADFKADPSYTTISTPTVDFINESRFVDDQTAYWWHFDDSGFPDGGTSRKENPSHRFSDTGLYTITLVAEDNNNCQDTLIREDYVEIDPNVIIHAPNAFTPDGDGKNDTYRVHAENFTSFEISIFNRWGERLYSADSYAKHREEGWDATYKGEPVPMGAYMYVVTVVGMNGEENSYSGTINVIR